MVDRILVSSGRRRRGGRKRREGGVSDRTFRGWAVTDRKGIESCMRYRSDGCQVCC